VSRVHLSRVVRTCNTSQEPNVTIPSASDTFSGMSFLPGRRLGVGLGADQPARKRSICSDGGPTVASDHRQVREFPDWCARPPAATVARLAGCRVTAGDT
jgi:hypothetical protein